MMTDTASLPPAARELIQRFETRQARVGVIGLGYVGLPLAVALAKTGLHVIGVDLDPVKARTLARGESYIGDVPAAEVAPLVRSGHLTAGTSFEALASADGVSICVPTPLRKTGDPDLSFILSAVQALRPQLHRGMVVILESTTYPGTTREMLLPEMESGGLKVGTDLFLAFSPERVDPGRKDWTTENTPKVIGGMTPACTAVASAMYSTAMKNIVQVSTVEVAEMTKLLENTFRAVNIAMVNEMALMCERLGVDVWEVIRAASTKPFGFMQFTPGPGLGGHCIPIDPHYLAWKMRGLNYKTRFIDLAGEVNTEMPMFWVRKVADALNGVSRSVRGSTILILGVAYKRDIDDLRESPALDIIKLLEQQGAHVEFHDPHVASYLEDGKTVHSVPLTAERLKAADCVMVVTDHTAIDYSLVKRHARLVVDTRHVMPRD